MHMAMNTHQKQWQEIELMTQQLHELSAEEDWQGMIDLESKRLVLLKEYFAEPVSEVEAELIAENIRRVMKSDDLLKQASQSKKEEAATAVKTLSNNQQAIKAYSHIQK